MLARKNWSTVPKPESWKKKTMYWILQLGDQSHQTVSSLNQLLWGKVSVGAMEMPCLDLPSRRNLCLSCERESYLIASNYSTFGTCHGIWVKVTILPGDSQHITEHDRGTRIWPLMPTVDSFTGQFLLQSTLWSWLRLCWTFITTWGSPGPILLPSLFLFTGVGSD